jgi:hypothetical protein
VTEAAREAMRDLAAALAEWRTVLEFGLLTREKLVRGAASERAEVKTAYDT